MVNFGSNGGRNQLWLACAVLLAAGTSGCSSPSTSTRLPQVDVAATSVPKPATSYIFGRITAEDGSKWTIKGIRGNVYSVIITPRTDFGSLFHRQARAEFKVGADVRIAGIFSGTAVTANAVVFAK